MIKIKSYHTVAIGFSLSIALMGILLYSVIKYMTEMDQRIKNITDIHIKKLTLVSDMLDATRERQLIILNVIVLPNFNEQQNARLKFHSLAGKYKASYDQLANMKQKEQENIIIMTANTMSNKAYFLQNNFFELLVNDDSLKKINDALRSATTAQIKIIEQLKLLRRYLQEVTNKAIQDTNDTYTSALKLAYNLGGFTILLSILIAILVIRKNISQTQKIEQLATLPADNPSPVFRISSFGRIVFTNEAGLPILKSFNCKTGDIAPNEWRLQLRNISQIDSEVDLEIKSQGRTFSFRATSVSSEGYINLYGHDVTKREHTKRELESRAHQNEELARLPVENPSPILKIATTGEILFANNAGQQILTEWNSKLADIIPKEWLEQLRLISEESTTSFLYQCSTGQIFAFKVFFSEKNGYINLFGYDTSELKKTRTLKLTRETLNDPKMN